METYPINDFSNNNYTNFYSNEQNSLFPETRLHSERVVLSHKFLPPRRMNSYTFGSYSAQNQCHNPYPVSTSLKFNGSTNFPNDLSRRHYQGKLKLKYKTSRSFIGDSNLAFEQEKTNESEGMETPAANPSHQLQLSHYNHVPPLLPKPAEPLQLIRWQQRPKFATCFWKEENTLCYLVDANNVCVARRQDNDMVNGTKLLNAIGMSRGKRDGILKHDKTRVVVKSGSIHLKGVWITFQRAKELAFEYGIGDILYPLLLNNPSKYPYENKDKPLNAFGDSIQSNIVDNSDSTQPHFSSSQEDSIPPSEKHAHQSPDDASIEQQNSLQTSFSSTATTPTSDYILHPTLLFSSIGLYETPIPSEGRKEYTNTTEHQCFSSEKVLDQILFNQSFHKAENYFDYRDTMTQPLFHQTGATTYYGNYSDSEIRLPVQQEFIPFEGNIAHCTYTAGAPLVPQINSFNTYTAASSAFEYNT